VSSVALANSGTVGITVSGDESGAVWDLTNGACLNMLEGHSGEVRSVVLTRHGRYVAPLAFQAGLGPYLEVVAVCRRPYTC
jgi:hypothetical protein